jgi:alpha-methylacyl-CoA racemase
MPTPPVNAVGDFGGGGMLMAFGLLAGILRARATGQGCVIDAAIVDGAALLSAQTWSFMAAGMWRDERGANFLDSGAAFYDSYRCQDGAWVAVGALEPRFFAQLKQRLGLASGQGDVGLRDELTRLFASRPRAHWLALVEGTDACLTPVLSLADAPAHPHNRVRGVFVEPDGIVQPAPAPRFLP